MNSSSIQVNAIGTLVGLFMPAYLPHCARYIEGMVQTFSMVKVYLD